MGCCRQLFALNKKNCLIMKRHPWQLVANIIFTGLLGAFMGYLVKSNLGHGETRSAVFEELMIVYLSMSVFVPIFFLGPCNFMMN